MRLVFGLISPFATPQANMALTLSDALHPEGKDLFDELLKCLRFLFVAVLIRIIQRTLVITGTFQPAYSPSHLNPVFPKVIGQPRFKKLYVVVEHSILAFASI